MNEDTVADLDVQRGCRLGPGKQASFHPVTAGRDHLS